MPGDPETNEGSVSHHCAADIYIKDVRIVLNYLYIGSCTSACCTRHIVVLCVCCEGTSSGWAGRGQFWSLTVSRVQESMKTSTNMDT
ncbi:hypothetical protein GDO78_022848 [Eleutherodactylus coqui]|uniref:Uncharacterized protein n=1 Tax=Eleutherodactylus coqui TaxID=57060 RepID=A0A8J6BG20_ELECQ|nr:hypothetical protein GDO78_022848 [Eleutherodactylus coqui]